MVTCVGKVGETIVVDNELCISLLGVRDNKILLCFNDPKEICIHRKENNQIISPLLEAILNIEKDSQT